MGREQAKEIEDWLFGTVRRSTGGAMKRSGRKLVWLVLGLVLVGAVALLPAAWGATARGADTVTIAKGESFDGDLYVAGNTVTIDGTVTGDVVGVAQKLVVNGAVTNDLNFAAQTIVVNGQIHDDARLAAQYIQIGPKGQVRSDLVCAEQTLRLMPGGWVGRDLWSAGAMGLIEGEVGRNMLAAFGGLQLNSLIKGDEIGRAHV